MDTNKILSSHILDILFEGRNKQYGAYDLRKTYNRRLAKSLLLTATLGVLVFFTSLFANNLKRKSSTGPDLLDTRMAELKKEMPPPPVVPPPKPKPTPPPEMNQVKFTPPKIMKDEDVKPEDKIEDIKDDQVISAKTVVSDNKEPIVQAPIEDKNTQVADVKVADDENKIFLKVEKEAEFPGGEGAWGNYLRKNLNANIPADNGAEPGVYTVTIKFVVSKDGSLSDIICENDPGYGMCQEALRVIKKTKNWTPALQNGQHVNAYRRQPITFQVEAQ